MTKLQEGIEVLYTVSDIALDYAPGEEIIGTVEADSPEAAILAALKVLADAARARRKRL